jgi:hypothetical protein
MEKGMKVTFSWRLIAAIAGTTAVAGGCLAGCGSSSPTVTVTATPSATSASAPTAGAPQPGTAGLPTGQGTFQIRGSVTEFDSSSSSSSSKQSIALQGTVDGLALTATGTGNGLAEGTVGQGNYCGDFGVVGSSASGTLGGVPFTVTLTGCSVDTNNVLTVTYTGHWGGRAVNVTLTANANSDYTSPGMFQPTLSGTVGTQQVSGTCCVPNFVRASGAPGQTTQISGTITVS